MSRRGVSVSSGFPRVAVSEVDAVVDGEVVVVRVCGGAEQDEQRWGVSCPRGELEEEERDREVSFRLRLVSGSGGKGRLIPNLLACFSFDMIGLRSISIHSFLSKRDQHKCSWISRIRRR